MGQALSGSFGDDATDSAARIRRLREALSLQPDHLWAHAWLAEVYRRVGENELATRHSREAVAVEPGWLPPRLALAELLRQSGDHEASLEQARRAWMLAPPSSPVAARAFVISASRLPDVIDADTRQRLLPLSEQLLGSLGSDPELTAARARLLHTHEGTQAAARFVRSQLPNADASVLRELLAVDRALDLGLRSEVAQTLADRASDADGDGDGDADAEADALRRIVIDPQNPELAAEAIADLLEQAPYREDPAWWARYARALDAAEDPRAIDAWRRAVAFDEEDPRVLRAALDSASVLAEPDWYRQLTGRLRAMTGDDAVGWKVAEASYLLAHDPGSTAASRARKLLQEVVELAPHRSEALLLLAEANRQLGHRDDQRAALERAFQELGGASAEPGLRLVDLYHAAGETDRADAVLDRLTEAGRYSTAEVRRIARKLLASARLRDALQLLDDHATAEPESARSLLPMRADLHLALGRTDRAVELYEDALDDAEPETLRAAVRFFARLGEIQRARGLLDRLSKIDPTNALKMRVEFASRWGEAGELERMLDTALEREPEAAWVHRAMLQYRWQRDEVDAVAAALERAREEVPGDASFAAMEQALPLVRSFADHASMRILFGGMLDAGRESESLLEAMRVLAAVQRGEAEPEAAASELASLAAAARVEPLTAVAAGMLADTGRTRAAAELASSRMRAVGSPRLAEIAARAWMALGDPASALPAAFAWHQRDPNNPRATAMIVRASAALDKRQDRLITRLAATLDELVSQPDPALADIREVSLAMLSAGRDSSLRTALEPRLEDGAAWRRLWLQLALEAMDTAASRSDATPWIDPLLDHGKLSDPDEVAALCDGLRRLGERIEGANFAATRRDLARKALERAPQHARLLLHLALALEQLGETERAADAYQRVLESDPDDVVSMNNLAVLLSELGRDLDHALSLVDRAISRYPELSALHDTRGQVLAAMGRAGDATQAYETAVSLQPESLKWRVHLARHLASTQKWQRTREVLNEIESLAGQREDGVPRALRDEYLAIREAARTAE